MSDEMKNTQVAETTDPAPEGQETGTEAAGEKVTAFQRFLDGLFGNKEKAAPEGTEKADPEGTGKDAPEGKPEKTFTQADLDAAVEKAKKEWETKAAEEKRLAGLSPEEKEKEEQKQKDAQIADLQAQILKSQLRQEAVSSLEKDGFPSNLADLLDYSSKENMEASLKNVTGMFKGSLEAGLKQRLKGRTPEGLGAAGAAENMLRDQIAKNIRGL